ncbi:M23 family metallopeptidase [Vallitalea sp.]|jgi:murein DD-endopeptidase MepM/ murein hydrolase activator NlpD|uniref:M23 family metallopeptidase n=1 Tax=Vallitalea sp. TaxID=1882829 RepID=UPI0025FFFF6B|nr:M23 family metallopeptidase [Vallitalea sp.]MCT4686054.1 M23 family metallopeptidase [Vallitalea sp.]
MSKDFNNPTRINLNNSYIGNLTTYGDNWFYTEFNQSGTAVFEVVPSSGLSVNLYIYDKNDNNLAISTSGSQGDLERIEYNVSAGQWIRMDVQYASGAGSFALTCKMKSVVTPPTTPAIVNVSGTHTTYYGPNTSYMKAGSVSNESVTLLWQEGSYYFIEYNISGSKKKRAYVRTWAIPSPGTIPSRTWNSTGIRYILNEGDVYTCQASSHSSNNTQSKKICTIAKGTEVTYFSVEKPNGWAFIEFTYKDGQKVRGYYWAGFMGGSKPYLSVNDFKSYKKNYTIPAGYSMAGYTLSQGFNDKSTNRKGHLGYDILGTKARALFAGKVVGLRTSYETNDGLGLAVVLEHTINNQTFYSNYHHLQSIDKDLYDGKTVSKNQEVGTIGDTGSEGATHLHLAVYTDQKEKRISGYCSSGSDHPYTFEQISKVYEYKSGNYPKYFYGTTKSDYSNKYPRCKGLRFYDPYGVVSTEARVISEYENTLT